MKKRYDLGQLDKLSERDLDAIHGELLELSIVLDREIWLLTRTMYISNWLVDETVAKSQDEYEAMCAPLRKNEKRLEFCRDIIKNLDEHIMYLLGRWVFDEEIKPEQFDDIKAAVGIAQSIKRMVGTRESIENQDGPYLGYIYRMEQEEAINAQSLFSGGKSMTNNEVKNLKEIRDELGKLQSRLALAQDVELDILREMTKDMIDTEEYKVANKAAKAMDNAYYHIEDALSELDTLLKDY